MKGYVSRREFVATAVAAGVATALSRAAAQPPEFDYVIVGAGSSGCVAANRLSANPDLRVLLVEAGGPDADPRLHRPAQWTSLIGSEWDWRYETTPQAQLGGRRVAWPRGRTFGGSSAINAMAFVRGHRLDFDGWGAAGNDGWSPADLLPLFRKSEDNSRGASEYHGGGGPLTVADVTDPQAAHVAFLEAARALGYDAAPDWDFSGPRQERGAGFYQKTIRNGQRHSVASAFLTPVLARANLEARPRALVTRLVIERGRAVGIEYLRDGQRFQARARREVILSAGVIESPRLLMLSGLGPAGALKTLGIPVAADLPDVGANLQDHLRVGVRFAAARPSPGSGVSAGLFTWSSDAASLAAAPPDLHFYLGRGLDQPDNFVTITVAVGRPESRGTVTLRSADPAAPPIIDARYLADPRDVSALAAGVRIIRALAAQKAFDAVRGAEVEPGAGAGSDDEVASFIRRTADTIFHPAGTCRMGTDRLAVVDSQLRVCGVERLRVADASIMPRVVNAPTNAACVMIGEKAAELIIEAV